MLCSDQQTFPAQRRIRKKAEFELAFKEKRTINAWFILNVRENGRGTSRLGIALSKRNIPKAASRNYAKRVVREVFRRTLPPQCGLDVVIGVRRPLVRQASAAERAALVLLFRALLPRCENSSSD